MTLGGVNLLKSANGLAYTSVKSRNGLLTQAFKAINGLQARSSPTPEILWWKCNDGSGTAVSAAVGVAGITDADWTTGESGFGFALNLNGTDDEVYSNGNVSYGSPGIITLTMWVWFDNTTPVQVVHESSASFGANPRTFFSFVSGSNIVAGVHDAAGGVYTAYCATPSVGQWVHIAFVLDFVVGNVKMFFDAVEQSLVLQSDTFGAATTAQDYVLNIGSSNQTSFFMDGRVDDIRVYTGELTTPQIALVYNDPQ